ncbi:hypothetical protein MSG28_008739 [Choristoneura fumiferana]|uniref:Uncharacterized protein n=1 Tax=Choristoneura fumiferana TaxID=7141 RepID=A0ACC0J7V2_CHOFU|nr:hypothetical protein MSG28_008739 [Choristoneura fumiferana]
MFYIALSKLLNAVAYIQAPTLFLRTSVPRHNTCLERDLSIGASPTCDDKNISKSYSVVVWNSLPIDLRRVKSLPIFKGVQNNADSSNGSLTGPTPLHIAIESEARKSLHRIKMYGLWNDSAPRTKHTKMEENKYLDSITAMGWDKMQPKAKWAGLTLPEGSENSWHTDESKMKSGTGAGIHAKDFNSSVSMGNYATVFQAETAQENIDRKVKEKTIYILSDRQAALKALTSPKVDSRLIYNGVQALNKLGRRNKGTIKNAINDHTRLKHQQEWKTREGLKHSKRFIENVSTSWTKKLWTLSRKQLRHIVRAFTGHFDTKHILVKMGLQDNEIKNDSLATVTPHDFKALPLRQIIQFMDEVIKAIEPWGPGARDIRAPHCVSGDQRLAAILGKGLALQYKRGNAASLLGTMNSGLYRRPKSITSPFCLAFVNYEKAFDSIETWAVLQALQRCQVDYRYIEVLKCLYENATMSRGVRQGDGDLSETVHGDFSAMLADLSSFRPSCLKINIDKTTEADRVRRFTNGVRGPADEVSVASNKMEDDRGIAVNAESTRPGFTVALFYCFMNTEVRHAIRYHVERWKTGRAIAGGRRRGASCSKDWSPRSRTESIRTNTACVFDVVESQMDLEKVEPSIEPHLNGA